MIGLLAALACAPQEGPVVDNLLWDFVAEADDPMAEHRPADERCDGWWLEQGLVEFDTGTCPYLALEQPALLEGRAGDRLSFGVLWGPLSAAEPAQAHLALSVDDQIVYERFLEIPGPEGADVVEITVEEPFRQGAAISWHAHNHGANQYRFGAVSVQRP